MKKEELYIGATSSFMGMIEQEPETFKPLMGKLLDGILFYRDQFNQLSLNALAIEVMQAFCDKVDEEMRDKIKALESTGTMVSCKAGCGHCCKQLVDVTEVETDLIVSWLREKGRTVDIEQLELRKDLAKDDYFTTPYAACVFLDENNLCTVYEVRPIACRKHIAINEPDDCNVQKYPRGRTTNPVSMDVEMIASGLMNIDTNRGNLATMLINSLKK